MEEVDDYTLDFPPNVKTRFEVYNGIGIKEILTTTVVGIIAFIISILLKPIIKNTFICILIVLVVSAGTLLGNMKDKGNQCIFGTIKNMFKFAKGQKYFSYKRKENSYALIKKDI